MSSHLSSFFDFIKEVVEENVPLNRILGVRLLSLGPEGARLRVDMKQELVGNYALGILHGGVISCLLDVAGSVTAYLAVLPEVEGAPLEDMTRAIARIGTADLRIDFLRPGKGTYFTASGSILKQGRTMATLRSELRDDQDRLVAAGTGTYVIR